LRRGFLPQKPGTAVRLLAYTNYANIGIYNEAIAQFEEGLVPRPDITNHPWHITRKYVPVQKVDATPLYSVDPVTFSNRADLLGCTQLDLSRAVFSWN
jgi:hypothetical protein